MREIKFRQYIRSAKTFHYWGFVRKGEFEEPISPRNTAVGDTQQFTGLYDKNGKEIYEGDILACRDRTTNINYPTIVEWDDDCPGYQISVGIPGCRGMDVLEKIGAENDEVIGNIHENLELLEVEDE